MASWNVIFYIKDLEMSIRKANDSYKNCFAQREGREELYWATDETDDAELQYFALKETQ